MHCPPSLVVSLVLAWLVVASRPDDTADGVELLKDPAFVKGIGQGYASHLSPAERAECQAATHAIFEVAFVMLPTSATPAADEGTFCVIVPAIYSEGGGRHVSAQEVGGGCRMVVP